MLRELVNDANILKHIMNASQIILSGMLEGADPRCSSSSAVFPVRFSGQVEVVR